MPARGGGGGGTPPTPGTPGTVTLADGAASRTVVMLESPGVGQIGVLAEATIRISENVNADTLPSAAGPAWAELWLIRATGGQFQIDKGFVRGGGARGLHSVVGFIGRINYRRGDSLALIAANDSGGSLTLDLEKSMAFRPEEEEEAAQKVDPLSTEHEAWYRHSSKIKSDNAGGALMTWTFTPNLGDRARIVGGRLTNVDSTTGVAADGWIDASATVRLHRSFFQYSTAQLATGSSRPFPTPGNTAGTVEAPPHLAEFTQIPPGGRFIIVTGTVDQNKEFQVDVLMLVKGRKPVVSVTANAGTATVTTALDAVS